MKNFVAFLMFMGLGIFFVGCEDPPVDNISNSTSHSLGDPDPNEPKGDEPKGDEPKGDEPVDNDPVDKDPVDKS